MIKIFKSVTLYTNKLQEMQIFYRRVLELPIVDETECSFAVQIGQSTLTFLKSDERASYHFAFNFPGNEKLLTKKWVEERVKLNVEIDQDEIYYKSFGADAFYFDDPAGNVVEYIGRRNKIREGAFSSPSLKDISEVSVTTSFVEEVANEFQQIDIHSRNANPIKPDSLNFLGKDDTYVILVPPDRRWYFSKEMSIVCPLTIEFSNGENITINRDGKVSGR